MEHLKGFFQRNWVMALVVVFGLAARMAVSMLGHSYDMDSYWIVAQILHDGGNVYVETLRYNYGPVWFQILHLLDMLALHRPDVLHYLVVALLSLVDAGIFFILCRRAGNLAGALFFLNPVSILVTGFVNQFDNLAILLGLLAVQWFGDDFDQPVKRRKLFGLSLLGLSLATKHLLFAFPLWLAVKQKGRAQKLIVLLVPVLVFLAGFVPYCSARTQILDNVFYYRSSPESFFYKLFVPQVIQYFLDSQTVWYVVLVLFAFFCRAKNAFVSLLVYLGVLVAASPATAIQYLAIPVALVAVYPNLFFMLFTAFSVLHFCVDKKGLGLLRDNEFVRFNNFAIYSLCCGIVWLMWRQQICSMFRIFFQEFKALFQDD